MKIYCPECGERVPATNINIQKMTAVCPACDTVFQFEPPEPKMKRRKVKKPDQMTITETETHLEVAFRTNFRLDRDETFLSSASAAGMGLMMTFFTAGAFFSGEVSLLLPLVIALLTVAAFYWMALRVYNQTHIRISDERIQVSRQPLPNPLVQHHTIGLVGVERIRYEETPASKREGYDTPRFNVWAETVDKTRKMIISDMVEEYAVYITQYLNQHLLDDTLTNMESFEAHLAQADDGDTTDVGSFFMDDAEEVSAQNHQ